MGRETMVVYACGCAQVIMSMTAINIPQCLQQTNLGFLVGCKCSCYMQACQLLSQKWDGMDILTEVNTKHVLKID